MAPLQLCLLFTLLWGSMVVKPTVQENITDFVAKTAAGRQVDLVIVLDRSKSFNQDTFYFKAKVLAERLLRKYARIHPVYTRVAAITFAKDSTVNFDFISNVDNAKTKCEIFQADSSPWDSLVFTSDLNLLSGTNLPDAMRQADEIFNQGRANRMEVTQIMLVISDFDNTPDEFPQYEVKALTDAGVDIFTVGAGNWNKDGGATFVASHDNYYGRFNVWNSMIINNKMTFESANIDPFDVPNGVCGMLCGDHSSCYCDADLGVEKCLCDAGYHLNATHQICQPCEVHTYKTSVGNAPCTPCPPPTESDKTGATSRDSCMCPPGSTVTECKDQCEGACLNSENCAYTGMSTHDCTCKDGYVGDYCEQDQDECASSPCLNGAECVNLVGKYMCLCQPGFEGDNCQNDVDECAISDFCLNGGTCVNKPNNYVCECPPYGWVGHNCQDVRTTTATTTTTVSTTSPPTTTPTTTTASTTTTATITTTAAPPTPTAAPTTNPTTTTTTTAARMTTTTTTTTTTEEPGNTGEITRGGDGGTDQTMLYIVIGACVGAAVVIIVAALIIAVCVVSKRRYEKAQNNTAATVTEEQTKVEDGDGGDAPKRESSGRMYRQYRHTVRNISTRFSGFWQKKTVRGGQFIGDPAQGLPSVPKRRPDLLGNLDTLGKAEHSNEVEYAYIENDHIEDTGGMDGWVRYVNDIRNSGIVTKACIIKLEGRHRKKATTPDWHFDESEMEKIELIMIEREQNVPCLVQGGEYHVHDNDGVIATAATIGVLQEPRTMTIGRTKTFIIVGVAKGDTDSGQCAKEIMWITDHIRSEGY